MRFYNVYILRCADGSYYTGVTNNTESRFCSHSDGDDPSCYTFKRRPLKLVYTAEFCEVMDAIAWEKQIKRWSRKKKEALINREYERLPMLSRNQCCVRLDHLMLEIKGKYKGVLCMVRQAHHDTVRVLLSKE